MDTKESNKTERNKALDELFRDMYKLLLGFARGYLDPNLAENAVQETFLVATQRFDIMMDSGNVEGWLMNTLKFKIKNIRRQKQTQDKHNILVEDLEAYIGENNEDTIASNDEMVLYEWRDACIQEVGKEAFEQLVERYVYRTPIKDAAAKYGMSESAYKSRTSRTRKRLHKFLENFS